MNIGHEMLFETTIRAFLGERAYHIAGQAHEEKYRLKWYRQVLKKVAKRVQAIDTHAKHKEQLEFFTSQLLTLVNARHLDERVFSWYLLRLVGTLLGFLSLRGSCLANLVYYQDPDQHYTQLMFNGGDVMQSYYDQQSATAERARLVHQLRGEGLNDFQISLVFGISEYQVKKLRTEL